MRKRNWPELPPPSQCEVAPHRYTWNSPESDFEKWREIRENSTYKQGEVVYVVYGDGYRKAYIVRVTCDRGRYGELREAFIVRPENTTSDRFAHREYIAHPGYIQRGYKRAGMAPDIPEGAL